jgi:ATP-dependent DNA helicase RecQ
VLRGNTRIELRRERKRPPKSKPPKKTGLPALDAHRRSPVFDALRQLRKRLADETGVPPYVIFHDSTLLEMVERRPTTHEDFAALGGVGQRKLERYADAFLAVLREDGVRSSF